LRPPRPELIALLRRLVDTLRINAASWNCWSAPHARCGSGRVNWRRAGPDPD